MTRTLTCSSDTHFRAHVDMLTGNDFTIVVQSWMGQIRTLTGRLSCMKTTGRRLGLKLQQLSATGELQPQSSA